MVVDDEIAIRDSCSISGAVYEGLDYPCEALHFPFHSSPAALGRTPLYLILFVSRIIAPLILVNRISIASSTYRASWHSARPEHTFAPSTQILDRDTATAILRIHPSGSRKLYDYHVRSHGKTCIRSLKRWTASFCWEKILIGMHGSTLQRTY